jgi:Protein of unknown function (DUF1592)/Protein of unknown function (DUF1588)/Protein of unknown function (DUF1595)/Protein of unknown function (DUF1585)/Protein of unknown function (DUF1587)
MTSRTSRITVLLGASFCATLLGAGCDGAIGGNNNMGGAGLSGTAGTAGIGGSVTGPADPNAAGLLPARRLTSREYLNTIRDLLNDTTLKLDDVPGESDDLSNNAFPFRQPAAIGTLHAATLQAAAETLAKSMSTKLSTILPCTPANAAAEAGCAGMFITTFGAKAYRRPLTTAESTTLNALYQTARGTLALDFNGSVVLLLEAMLQAPGFIYHWEMDPGPAIREGAVVQLGNYQVASRLSYFLWGTMPDTPLFAAAAAGELSTTDGIGTQVTRMLADSKAQSFVADFIEDWLDVNVLASRPKDPMLYAMWNQDLASAMETEFRTFGTTAVLGTGLFADLLTGNKSSVNQALAAVYGVSGVTGTTPRAVTFDANQRAGLLTLAGFLTVTGASNGSSPVGRGHAIYTRILCGVLPDPPANVPPPAPPTPGLTTRQRFEEHDMNPCTGACHAAMDPIGYGFEHYDGIGAYRTTDQNLPVDSNGSIVLDGQTHTFPDAVALAKLLADSPTAQACFARQMTRYALNRWDTAADAASIEAAATRFKGTLNMRDLIAGVATSRTFRYRAPAAGEVLP